MNIVIIGMLLLVNIPLYKKIFYLIFKTKEDFYECMRFVFTPDLISLFRREYTRDYFGELKVSFFMFLCGGLTILEYFAGVSLIEFVTGRI